jgi:hypothetical protein
MKRRSSYLSVRDPIELGKGEAATVWGYSKSEKFVCRLEISSAGVAVYSGEKGGKLLGNLSWEQLVEKLAEE